MDRRDFLKQSLVLSASLAVGFGGLGGTARAEASPQRPVPRQAGHYWLKIGDVDVAALSDGTLRSKAQLLNAQPGQLERLLRESYVAYPRVISVNAFLIVKGDRLILVDTGAGTLMGPTLDKLPASLAVAGVGPGDVTDILLTHIHGDHSGGLTIGDAKVFPKATVHVSRQEAGFWLDAAGMAAATGDNKARFAQAKRSLAPYADAGKLHRFEAGQEVLPGVGSLPAPGHTPGHTYYVLESRGEKLVFWGDTVHVAEVQFSNPEIAIEYDIDPAGAVRQRQKAMTEAAAQGYLVAGAHISFPGIGHVGKDGDGYRFIPAPYVNEAIGG